MTEDREAALAAFLSLEKISAETMEGAVLLTTRIVTGCSTPEQLMEELNILLDQYAVVSEERRKGGSPYGNPLTLQERKVILDFILYMRQQQATLTEEPVEQ